MLSHLLLGVSGGGGGREAKAGSRLLRPGQAAPLIPRASGALPRAGDLAHSLNRKSKGTTIPREVRLADVQPSRLPGAAVSPCFSPILLMGFPETPNRSCDRRVVQELHTFLKFLTLFSDPCSPVPPPQTYPFIMSNSLLSSGEESLVDS